jgi:hypothetical protein
MIEEIATIKVICPMCGESIRFEVNKSLVEEFGTSPESLYRYFPRWKFPEWDINGTTQFCNSKCRGKDIVRKLWLGTHSERTGDILVGIMEQAYDDFELWLEKNNKGDQSG